jgi:hypothetical protein
VSEPWETLGVVGKDDWLTEGVLKAILVSVGPASRSSAFNCILEAQSMRSANGSASLILTCSSSELSLRIGASGPKRVTPLDALVAGIDWKFPEAEIIAK